MRGILKLEVPPADAVQWTIFFPRVTSTLDNTECTLLDPSTPETHIQCLLQTVEDELELGRLERAQYLLERLLDVDPLNADGLTLQAVLHVVAGQLERAEEVLTDLPTSSQRSVRAGLARSYLAQARKKLFEALDEARALVIENRPAPSYVWARLSELELATGSPSKALACARQATAISPDDPRASLSLGYALLVSSRPKDAALAFAHSIEQDGNNPAAHLGLGLAYTRLGDITKGRDSIATAAVLAPNVALYRSFLANSYSLMRSSDRLALATEQLDIAKQLDPNDPTPWLYSAIVARFDRRPVDAARDMVQSLARNRYRAVLRPHVFLQSDDATRRGEYARINDDLGFTSRSRDLAVLALPYDPANPSLHRFLSDAYVRLPRHEIARSSELLQSQLRAPLGSIPVQSQLGSDDFLYFSGRTAPLGGSDFSSLMTASGPNLRLEGLRGDQNLWGEQISVSVLTERSSLSFSQSRLNSNGYRQNSDDNRWRYAGLLHIQATENLFAQLEFSSDEQVSGDLVSRFDPTFFSRSRRQILSDSVRASLSYTPDPSSTYAISLIQQLRRASVQITPTLGSRVENDSTRLEAQNTLRGSRFSLVTGLSHFVSDTEETIFGRRTATTPFHYTIYSYASIWDESQNIVFSPGLSWENFHARDSGSQRRVLPKIGLSVSNEGRTFIVRAAYFEVLKRRLSADQALEPTSILGFNQFYDDVNGSYSRTKTLGLSAYVGSTLSFHLDAFHRDVLTPLTNVNGTIEASYWNERIANVSAYWLPTSRTSVSAEARVERFSRPRGNSGAEAFLDVETDSVPVTVRQFWTNRVSASATVSWVKQRGRFLDSRARPFDGSESFCLIDFAVDWTFLSPRTMIRLELLNALDERFRFQATDLFGARLPMSRTALVRFVATF